MTLFSNCKKNNNLPVRDIHCKEHKTLIVFGVIEGFFIGVIVEFVREGFMSVFFGARTTSEIFGKSISRTKSESPNRYVCYLTSLN